MENARRTGTATRAPASGRNSDKSSAWPVLPQAPASSCSHFSKALDENGTKLFSPGEIDVLKNEVKDKDLQTLMLAILTDDSEPMDPKS